MPDLGEAPREVVSHPGSLAGRDGMLRQQRPAHIDQSGQHVGEEVGRPQLPGFSVDPQHGDEVPERAGERILAQPLHPEAGRDLQQLLLEIGLGPVAVPQVPPQRLEPPPLAAGEAEAVPRQQRGLVEREHVQAVAQEPLPVDQVPVHARLLLQRPERPAVGVLRVRARQQQPRHQRHARQAGDAAAEEHAVHGRRQPPQRIVFRARHAAAEVDLAQVSVGEVGGPAGTLQPVGHLVLGGPVGEHLLHRLLLALVLLPLLLDLRYHLGRLHLAPPWRGSGGRRRLCHPCPLLPPPLFIYRRYYSVPVPVPVPVPILALILALILILFC